MIQKPSKFLMLGALALGVLAAPVPAQDALDSAVMAPEEGVAGSYLSSQFARTSGDVERAVAYLRRAHQKDLANQAIAEQLQALLVLGGHVEEAIKTAAGAKTRSPLGAMLLSIAHFKKGEFDRAREVLAAATFERPQLWAPLFSAWVDISRQALAAPLTLEQLSPDASRSPALVHYHLALINARAGFVDAAAENFRLAIANTRDPSVRVIGVLAKFYDANRSPVSLLPIMQALGDQKSEALGSAEDVGGIASPEDGIAEILLTMGQVAQAVGSAQDAVIYLHLARHVKPDFPIAALALADAVADLKQVDRARALYLSIPAKSALYVKAQLHLASALEKSGRAEEALAQLDQAAKTHPGRYEFLLARGDLLRGRKQFAEAAAAYSRALPAPKDVRDEHWAIFFARGISYERLGDWKAAEADFLRALTHKPDQPEVLNYLAYGWVTRRERLDEAKTMLEKAVRARPNDPQMIDSLGWALYALQQYEPAVTQLEKAVDLLPGDPTINDHLGDAYWQIGRKTEARYQWEKALSFSPEPKDAELIRGKLQTGAVGSAPLVAGSSGAVSAAP